MMPVRVATLMITGAFGRPCPCSAAPLRAVGSRSEAVKQGRLTCTNLVYPSVQRGVMAFPKARAKPKVFNDDLSLTPGQQSLGERQFGAEGIEGRGASSLSGANEVDLRLLHVVAPQGEMAENPMAFVYCVSLLTMPGQLVGQAQQLCRVGSRPVVFLRDQCKLRKRGELQQHRWAESMTRVRPGRVVPSLSCPECRRLWL